MTPHQNNLRNLKRKNHRVPWEIQQTDWAKIFLLIRAVSEPLNFMLPVSGLRMSLIIFSNVDFPEPLGPMSPIKSLSWIESDKSFKTGEES